MQENMVYLICFVPCLVGLLVDLIGLVDGLIGLLGNLMVWN